MFENQSSYNSIYFKKTISKFTTGISIIILQDKENIPIGLTINSFNSVSLQPPIILWSLNKNSYHFSKIVKSKLYTIHILSSNQINLALKFSKGNNKERFIDLPLKKTKFGTILLNVPVLAWFECESHNSIKIGDHIVLFAKIINCRYFNKKPLIFYNGQFNLCKNNYKLN